MTQSNTLPGEIKKIIDARHHDPFSVLGKHPSGKSKSIIRAFVPHAKHVAIADSDIVLARLPGTDIFEWQGEDKTIDDHYELICTHDAGERRYHDPYTFPPQLAEFDIHLFSEGKHWHAYRILGANPHSVNGVDGILFATWAPNAERVSVVGDFNQWDGRVHCMRVRGGSGLWELFIPDLSPGTLYKFEIRNRQTGQCVTKTDPYGQQFEVRPNTASVVAKPSTHTWQDAAWLSTREQHDWLKAPMSIYEVHLGSWQHDEEGNFLNYRELAHRLVPYAQKLGFTHLELLPISEHPFDGSWGYQTTGNYAPTSRFGSPDDFRYFVDYCHQHKLGVILDWVPGHFPKDAHGLARFDGSALYEHEDPRLGEHKDWGTLIFNYGRSEVKNYLLSSAVYWLEEFHVDGLRVDAVASMLYLDYSREEGEWLPNQYGGNENLEAIDFMRQLNNVTHDQFPGTLIMAEESTSWPMVSRPTWLGGLGFSMKWNMGWMNDTLAYMSRDPIHRHFHHDTLTFSQLYAYTENFVLPFSHDEVVHGKKSLLNKMPGDEWQRFANLRLLYTYMFTHPGKKLLFMGCEFAQGVEWQEDKSLEWHLLDYPLHQGMQTLVGDLNRLYIQDNALHEHDFDQRGFAWVDCHDAPQSVLSYLRLSDDDFVIVALNFTPLPRHNYRLGVPKAGQYKEVFNSDSEYYGGSNVGNAGLIETDDLPWMNLPHSINITLPPLAGVIFKPAATTK